MSKPFVKYGVYYGLFTIIMTLAIYLLDPTLFGNMWFSFLLMPIPIIFMVLAVREEKQKGGGYVQFGTAFLQGLGVVVIGYVISGIFTYILYNFVDPGLEDVIKGSVIESMESYEDMMPEESYEKMIDDLDAKSFSDMGTIAMGLISMTFIGTIFSLIIAAIMKKARTGIETLDDIA